MEGEGEKGGREGEEKREGKRRGNIHSVYTTM